MSALQSMTGFSSAVVSAHELRASCEMRSVNGKSLDIRLRLPIGFETLETPIKKNIATHVSRGNVQVTLMLEQAGQSAGIHIDENAFAALAAQARALSVQHGLQAPTTDGILAVRGIVLSDDAQSAVLDDASHKTVADLLMKAVDEAAASLAKMREVEGASLLGLLSGHLASIEGLVTQARADKVNQPEAIMARLSAQLDTLLEGRDDAKLEESRLHAEAAVLATKADIREEIDRLDAHVAAARALLDGGGAIGRKLDFLAQEFNRETNTICSKSASATLTATGLDLKAVIDQFREQVQNLQ